MDKSLRKGGSQIVKAIIEGILDLIYPPICLLCRRDLEQGSEAGSEENSIGNQRQEKRAICADCLREIRPLLPPFCPLCGEQIIRFRELCEVCEREEPLPFVWRQSAGAYGGNLQHAIALLKYGGKSALAEPLGLFMVESLKARPVPLLCKTETEIPKVWTVVPVPLHPTRQRERGFNQAERLAKVVSREMGWIMNTQDLKRTRKTPQQAGIKEKKRRQENVVDAFRALKPDAFEGQSVLLIDDVLTTLATAFECAVALKNGGAKEVAVLVLARG